MDAVRQPFWLKVGIREVAFRVPLLVPSLQHGLDLRHHLVVVFLHEVLGLGVLKVLAVVEQCVVAYHSEVHCDDSLKLRIEKEVITLD